MGKFWPSGIATLAVLLAFALTVDGQSPEIRSGATIAVSVYLEPTPGPSIEMTSPNGGEVWLLGSKAAIRWESHGRVPNDLDIQLKKGGHNYAWLGRREKDDGKFDWKVKPNTPAGSDYTVEISSRSKPEISDESDASFSIAAHPTVVYVNVAAENEGDGASWASPLQRIQTAIDLEPAQIWIAGGRYAETLVLRSNMALYGGFSGAETSISDRQPEQRASLVCPDFPQPTAPQSRGLLLSEVRNVRIDGLAVSGGVVQGTGDEARGGGVFCRDVDDTVEFVDCTIAGNTAETGGGFYLEASSPSISGCLILGNHAQAGGGIFCSGGSAPKISRAVFANNAGRAIFDDATPGKALLTDCRFYENSEGDYSAGGDTAATSMSDAAHITGVFRLVDTRIRGNWSKPPYFDARKNATTFNDETLSLAPDCLIGQILKPSGLYPFHGLIVGNTSTSIEVVNDWTSCVLDNDTFELGSVHHAGATDLTTGGL